MSIDGLNVFGSLTINGKKLSFEDFDANKDGQISETEFKNLLAEVKCDTLELSSIDTSEDKVITEDEFADFEKKAQIQDALNELQGSIAKDFTGANAKYATQCMAELKDYTTNFVANYQGNGDIVADYKAALPAKYEEIKNNILNNTPEALAKKAETEKNEVKSKVFDEIFEQVKNEVAANHPELADSIANAIVTKLQSEANNFLKTYTGANLEVDLKAHLEAYMAESDAEKINVANYRETVDSLGGFIDENDMQILKDAAKDLFMQALEAGVTFTLNGVKLSSEMKIDSVLRDFNDAQALKDAIDSLINGLSTENLKDSIIKEKVNEKESTDAKAFASLKGSDVQIEADFKIDYNSIPGYNDNKTVTVKKQGKDGAKDDAINLLETHLKEQLKAEIKADLKAKGISEDKLDQVFENVFTLSALEAAEACVSGRKGGLFRSSKSSFNTKDLVDKFIEIFNKNMAATIDEMNKSNTDMDLQDVDWSLAVKDENGNVIPGLENIAEGMKTGETITNGYTMDVNLNETQANEMIDRMRSTMLKKSEAMCKANGIEFDNNIFRNIFENAKGAAVAVNTPESNFFGLEKSKINPQNLLKDFATNFETTYTAWVEGEKAKKANV